MVKKKRFRHDFKGNSSNSKIAVSKTEVAATNVVRTSVGATPASPANIEEPVVAVNVTPVININGKLYFGICRVKQSVASQLTRIMQEVQQANINVQLGTTHPTINLGEVGSSGIIKQNVKHIYHI